MYKKIKIKILLLFKTYFFLKFLYFKENEILCNFNKLVRINQHIFLNLVFGNLI